MDQSKSRSPLIPWIIVRLWQFFCSSRRRHTRFDCDWSSDVCSSDLCGWPTSLYLSDNGHDVTILDNLSRRKIDIELEVESLTPIQPIGQRLRAWQEVSGREIGFVNLDIATEYDRLVDVLLEKRPGAIGDFAAQRAAADSVCATAT